MVRLPSARTGRASHRALLVGVALGELALLRAPRHSVGSVVVVIVTSALAGLLILGEYRNSQLSLTWVSATIAIVVAAAVCTPPRTSNDLWSYTTYGRMVTVHHVSPYDHVPAEYRTDPFVQRVSPRWRHRASVYGPVFVGVSAAGALVAGPSPLRARLFFQILAALAVAFMLVVVWRTTRNLGALLFLGLNPVVTVIVVNGGHNDALVGAALVGAVLLAARRHPRAAGALVGVAVLIKLTAGLALVGLLLWSWHHQLKRFAVVLVSTATAVVVVGYLPVLVSASRVLGAADKTVTNASPWNWLVDRLLRHDAWREVARPLAPNDTLDAFFSVGLVAVVVIAVMLAWWAAPRRTPDRAVGVALAAYPLAAEYALPWYAAWSLPIFALDAPSGLSAVVWIQSVVMLAALKLPIAVRGSNLHAALRVALTDVAPPILLVAFVAVGWRVSRRERGLDVTNALTRASPS